MLEFLTGLTTLTNRTKNAGRNGQYWVLSVVNSVLSYDTDVILDIKVFQCEFYYDVHAYGLRLYKSQRGNMYHCQNKLCLSVATKKICLKTVKTRQHDLSVDLTRALHDFHGTPY